MNLTEIIEKIREEEKVKMQYPRLFGNRQRRKRPGVNK